MVYARGTPLHAPCRRTKAGMPERQRMELPFQIQQISKQRNRTCGILEGDSKINYRTEKIIIDDNGQKFKVGDTVGVTFNKASGHEGGGFGSATIAKITDTGFQYSQGGKRPKTVQLKNIKEIYKYR